MKYFKQNLTLTSLTEKPFDYAMVLTEMASIFSRKSDYDNAILYENQALQIFDPAADFENVINSLSGLAIYYYQKQLYPKAAFFAEKGLQLLANKDNDHHVTAHIGLLVNAALVAIKLRQFGKAEKYLAEAEKIQKQQDVNFASENVAFNKAFLYFSTEQWHKAQSAFEKTLQIYQEKYPSGHRNIGKAFYYLGKIVETQNLPKIALDLYQKSLTAFVPAFQNNTLFKNPNPEDYCRSKRDLMRSLIAKASLISTKIALQKTNNQLMVDQVIETFDLALVMAEKLRQSYKTDDARYFLAKETEELFDKALGFVHQMYSQTKHPKYLEKALFYLEKSQAPLLLKSHLSLEGQAIGGVPDSILQKEKQLAIDFAFIKKQLASANSQNDSLKIRNFTKELFDCQQKMETLQKDLSTQYPRYFEHQYGGQPVHLNTLQHHLIPNQLYLQYYVTTAHIFIFYTNSENADFLMINDAEDIRNVTKSLLENIQNPMNKKFSPSASYQHLAENSHFLFQRLMEPVLKNQPDKIKRMTIVADNFLTRLPFEVLINNVPQNTQASYLNLPYLIKDFAISYQPSAALMLRLDRQKNKAAKSKILAFAPFSTQNNEETKHPNRLKLGSLPYSKIEIENLEKLLPSHTFHFKQATKNTFLNLAADYQVLHIATHGMADFQQAANARLYFFPEKNRDSTNHILFDYEVQNLAFNADLAVLSACETGAGILDTGEGILSLARSFFYTGIPSILMSKWIINDRSSNLIINELYKNLKNKQPKDFALKNAKISYLHNEADMRSAHPFYWAGLVQLGNLQTLDFQPSNWIFWGSIFVLSVFIIVGLIFFSKKGSLVFNVGTNH